MKAQQLFPKEQTPRRKPRKLMHVYDAGGENGHHAAFKCAHCGYDNGWEKYPDKTITDLKRGLPCPKCN